MYTHIHTEEKYMSEVKHKNGYELRTDILAMAKDFVLTEYSSRQEIWVNTAVRDQQGKIIDASEKPEFPKLDQVLESAAKMYQFVERSR